MKRKHWTDTIKAENEQLKKQIEELKQGKYIEAFAREVGMNIMLILANTPYSRWPDVAKISFKHASERQEVSAYLYQQRLPKV